VPIVVIVDPAAAPLAQEHHHDLRSVTEVAAAGTADFGETEPAEPSESLQRLRVATQSRASLLREAHSRLEDDLSDLRSKARR
jgi:hypothetical protein